MAKTCEIRRVAGAELVAAAAHVPVLENWKRPFRRAEGAGVQGGLVTFDRVSSRSELIQVVFPVELRRHIVAIDGLVGVWAQDPVAERAEWVCHARPCSASHAIFRLNTHRDRTFLGDFKLQKLPLRRLEVLSE